MLEFIVYIVGLLSFCLFDGLIGWGVDFTDDIVSGPTAWFIGLFWPVAVPILMLMKFGRVCEGLKARRKEKAEKREKIRIALKREESQAIEDAEREVEAELRRQMRR